MKKLINDPAHVVPEMLAGIASLSPSVALLDGYDVVLTADAAQRREREVVLISGGGSGHEPAHAGYVGAGMLGAAVAGDVFTSPTVDAVLAAILAASGEPGALLVVKNYTGDRLNFGLAAELARAQGRRVEIVVVADDVSLPGDGDVRRGIAGTIFVHKVAGAAAAAGAPLAEVARIARETAAALGTMGVALGPCTVPAAGEPSFTLDETEIELGLGIHGEPGVRRATIAPADSLVAELIDTIVRDRVLGTGARVALLVNDLGATPPMELAIVANAALRELTRRRIVVERAYAGRFLTALEMPGVSLTLLDVDDARLAALDAPTSAAAWPSHPDARVRPAATPNRVSPDPIASADGAAPAARATDMRAVHAAFEAVAETFEEHERRLTELDRPVGDGDIGISLVRAAEALRRVASTASESDPASALFALAADVRRVVGGTTGPLYAAFLVRGAQRVRDGDATSARTWAEAFSAGCDAIGELGDSKPGDRTMLDALVPAADAFRAAVTTGTPVREAFAEAVRAANAGADGTARMLAKRGRARYLGERALGHVDPGAVAAALWIAAVADGL